MLKVLISDDNELIVKHLSKIINSDPRFELVSKDNTNINLIDQIQKYKPDLIITDIYKNGRKTDLINLLKIKSNEYNPKVFVVSGLATEFNRDIVDSHIEYYLNKPFLEETFIDKLDKIYSDIIRKKE